jgi:hypothetical protein
MRGLFIDWPIEKLTFENLINRKGRKKDVSNVGAGFKPALADRSDCLR